MQIQFESTHPMSISKELTRLRQELGSLETRAWRAATEARDPVNLIPKSHAFLNRATYKIREISKRVRLGAPRQAALLAEAPGGFLHHVRHTWPRSIALAMSLEAPDAISFRNSDDVGLMRSLPHGGDLLQSATRDALVHRLGERSSDLVTADGGFHVDDLDHEESSNLSLAIAQTLVALRVQSHNGTFILKIFEGATLPTRQLFVLLTKHFDSVYLMKPLSSRCCNSERYVVATGFRAEVNLADTLQRLTLCITSRKGLHVWNMGVAVPEHIDRAFDHMIATQCQAIQQTLDAVRKHDFQHIKRLAQHEAAELRDILFA